MKQRDIELLSAYLDGELEPSDSARLEARLKSDPELASVMNDLRATRALLRKLPQRRAPRNFTLTRKMVGQNPPLPRLYPVFRLATALAMLLFFFSFGLNALAPQLTSSQAPAFGMGGGGEPDTFAAQEAPAEAFPTEAPAEEPSIALAAPSPTAIPTDEAAREVEPPLAKGEAESAVAADQTTSLSETPIIPTSWQIGLILLALCGMIAMIWMRRSAARRWQ
ncbi:MAG TPA: zf-HC2 domain-containing protein [Anaerolineales bacterium]|nr:zf-HC2 domain-containing protein [Anaerolineales bacterium]